MNRIIVVILVGLVLAGCFQKDGEKDSSENINKPLETLVKLEPPVSTKKQSLPETSQASEDKKSEPPKLVQPKITEIAGFQAVQGMPGAIRRVEPAFDLNSIPEKQRAPFLLEKFFAPISEEALAARKIIEKSPQLLNPYWLGKLRSKTFAYIKDQRFHENLLPSLKVLFHGSEEPQKKEIMQLLLRNPQLSRSSLGLSNVETYLWFHDLCTDLEDDRILLSFFLHPERSFRPPIRRYLSSKYSKNLGSNYHLWKQHLDQLESKTN